jgi:hypothetical protein
VFDTAPRAETAKFRSPEVHIYTDPNGQDDGLSAHFLRGGGKRDRHQGLRTGKSFRARARERRPGSRLR